MRTFTALFLRLDQTTRTSEKIGLLTEYFQQASPADAAWATWFLSGRKAQRLVPTRRLRQWSAEVAGIEPWLFEECYEAVGDLAETMALILPPAETSNDETLHTWITARLLPLKSMPEDQQRAALSDYWRCLDESGRLVLHKLITGGFRVGVSQKSVVKGIAQAAGIAPEVIAHRMMGDWQPTADFFQSLIDPDTQDTSDSQPYPFYLANPLEQEPSDLGPVGDWQVEWKWDGIRAQLVKRNGEAYLWTRGQELVTQRYPEILSMAGSLPDGTVLDGELVGWRDGGILPFAELQRRSGRKKAGTRLLREVPVALISFDVLELDGEDIRERPLHWRRQQLERLVEDYQQNSEHPETLQASPLLNQNDWDALARLRAASRDFQTEGLMLKQTSGAYRVGRPRGEWWKWKIEPYTIDAVLVYAQRGHGRRASLYTDYTFAVWDQDQLVPFAKAYSGLTDREIQRVDRYVRQNTTDRFGPVRGVTPKLVFELAFENIQASTRHKSGIAVRFPRISRWREDLSIEDADSLDDIRRMMNQQPGQPLPPPAGSTLGVPKQRLLF